MSMLNEYINKTLKDHYKFQEVYQINQNFDNDKYHIQLIPNIGNALLINKLSINSDVYSKFKESIQNIIKSKAPRIINFKLIVYPNNITVSFEIPPETYLDWLPDELLTEISSYLNLNNINNLNQVISLDYKSLFRSSWPEYVKYLNQIRQDIFTKYQIDVTWKDIFDNFSELPTFAVGSGRIGDRKMKNWDLDQFIDELDELDLDPIMYITYTYIIHPDLYQYMINSSTIKYNEWKVFFHVLWDIKASEKVKIINIDLIPNLIRSTSMSIEDISYLLDYIQSLEISLGIDIPEFDEELMNLISTDNIKDKAKQFVDLLIKKFPGIFRMDDYPYEILMAAIYSENIDAFNFISERITTKNENFYEEVYNDLPKSEQFPVIAYNLAKIIFEAFPDFKVKKLREIERTKQI